MDTGDTHAAPRPDVEAEREELLRLMRAALTPEVLEGIALAVALKAPEPSYSVEVVTAGTTYAVSQ